MAVTKYKAIKWAAAAFEIVVAIIIILFGTRILFGVVPEEEQQRAVFSLIVALLWFLVIACIIAAVRNIILSLRPEPKNSLQTLSMKIDVLGTKLVTMGLASEKIPEEVPPSPEELKKGRNKKIMIAAAIVAAIVVLAAITTVFLMTKMGGGGNPAGGLTPDDTLSALIAAMNSKDANGVLSLTVYSFGNATMKSQFREDLIDMFYSAGASFHVAMNSHLIKYPADLNASETAELTGIQNEIQSHISNTVTASCMIAFNMTITTEQMTFYQDGNMPCFQIDGGWYLLLDFGDGGPDGDGGGIQQDDPQEAFWSFIDCINNRDAASAVGLTVYKFGDSSAQSEAADHIEMMWAGSSDFDASANNPWVQDASMMDTTEQRNLSNIRDNVQTKLGVVVSDSVFVHFQVTIMNDSGSYPMSEIWACLKINDLWYFVIDYQSFRSPIIDLTQGSTVTNWTLTVDIVDLAGGPFLYTTDVFLTVKYDNDTEAVNMTLDALIGAGWVNGTNFIDNNVIGQIDSSDVIQLDSAIYQIGSEVKLRNSDGTQVYCIVKITSP